MFRVVVSKVWERGAGGGGACGPTGCPSDDRRLRARRQQYNRTLNYIISTHVDIAVVELISLLFDLNKISYDKCFRFYQLNKL